MKGASQTQTKLRIETKNEIIEADANDFNHDAGFAEQDENVMLSPMIKHNKNSNSKKVIVL